MKKKGWEREGEKVERSTHARDRLVIYFFSFFIGESVDEGFS